MGDWSVIEEVRGAWSGLTRVTGRSVQVARIAFTPAALAVAAACAGCAGASGGDDAVRVGVETGASDPSIFGGAKDDDGQALAGVVALRVGTGGTFELCTGALVAANVVLTARHCVTKNTTTSVSCDEEGRSANGKHVAGDEEPATVGVYVGGAPNFAQKPTSTARAIVAPKGPYLCDSDIALVVLREPITSVKPLPVRLSTAAQPGETIRSVGYGQNDAKVPIGTRFRKTGVEVLAQGKAVSPSKTPLGPHEFEVGKSICQGDSGGPAISEETGAVIGVVSRGGGCDEDFGHIYTTTSGFDALFEEAFAVAGAQPVLESGTPTIHTHGAPSKAATEETSSSEGGSCSIGRPRPGAPASSVALAGVALGLALVTARRRAGR
jgi:V8-like Glu-specific endopeptidase